MERPAEISKQKSNDSGRNLSMLDNTQLADILKLTNNTKSIKSIKNNNNNFTIVKSKSVSNNLVALQYFNDISNYNSKPLINRRTKELIEIGRAHV